MEIFKMTELSKFSNSGFDRDNNGHRWTDIDHHQFNFIYMFKKILLLIGLMGLNIT